jgi:hypothetical protein
MKRTFSWAGLLILCLSVVPVVSAESLLGDAGVQKDGDCGQKDDDCLQIDDCGLGKGCIEQDICCDPLWTVSASIVAMKRESPSLFPAFDFDYELGVDVSVMRQLNECRALEFRYLGVYDWNAELGGVVPNPNPNPAPDEPRLLDLNAAYTSNLHSTELNLRRQVGERVNLLAGFRWVELHEELGVSVFDLEVLNNNADNHMYGFQVGGDVLLWDRGGPFTVTTGLAAGIYYNNTDVTISVDVPNTLQGSETFEADQTAFLGEWDITGKLALTDNIALRASYDLIWVEGAAVAEGQVLSVLDSGNIDTSGSVFYHGGMLGIEITR